MYGFVYICTHVYTYTQGPNRVVGGSGVNGRDTTTWGGKGW